MDAPDPREQSLVAWRSLRRRAYRSWWINVAVAVVGGVWFARSYDRAEPMLFAVLVLIPLLALRGAWRSDREIRACDARIREEAERR